MDSGNLCCCCIPLGTILDHLAFRSLVHTVSFNFNLEVFVRILEAKVWCLSFCYSFYSSDHNPDIAVGEMPRILDVSRKWPQRPVKCVVFNESHKANSLTHTVRVRCCDPFLFLLINSLHITCIPG